MQQLVSFVQDMPPTNGPTIEASVRASNHKPHYVPRSCFSTTTYVFLPLSNRQVVLICKEHIHKATDLQIARAGPSANPSSPPRSERERKRKRAGEDDTDFEMRIARERATTAGAHVSQELVVRSEASLVDEKGHIQLFGPEIGRGNEKNEEAEKEKAKKKREFEDQYQMRFANAAGRDKAGLKGAWYATADGEASGALVPLKDVWGNEDPRRKVREAARLDASDPLAMMKRGAAKVRELTKERRREEEEREREMREMRREEKRRMEKRGEREAQRKESERKKSRREDRGREDDRQRYCRKSDHEGRKDSRDRHRDRPHDYDRNQSERHGEKDDWERHQRRSDPRERQDSPDRRRDRRRDDDRERRQRPEEDARHKHEQPSPR